MHKPTPEEVKALSMLRRLEREYERELARIKREDAQATRRALAPKNRIQNA